MRWRRQRAEQRAEQRADDAVEAAPRDERAHIVWPASKLDEAKRGEPVQARCGAQVSGDPIPGAAVCQECVFDQLRADDRASADEASKRFEAGRVAGVTDGRRQHANEIAVAAAEQARRDREQLEASRFEVIDDNRAVRFTFQDGTTATVRRDHIGSVLFDNHDGLNRVVVDGYVLIAHTDLELVRRHYARVHEAVFGGRVLQGS